MVFESLDPADPAQRVINATDRRFFWTALYAAPVIWVVLAIVALAKLKFIWLSLVGPYYPLISTSSRCVLSEVYWWRCSVLCIVYCVIVYPVT